MKWRELIEDNKTGRLSSARFISVLAGITLSIVTIALTVIAVWEVEVVPALTVAVGAIAGLASVNYASQKLTEKRNDGNERP